MPELPEVETVARQLAGFITGLPTRRLLVFDPKLEAVGRRDVRGLLVARVFRRGKQVLIELASPESPPRRSWLAIHLRMSGRLIWAQQHAPRPHLRAALEVDEGAVLLIDPRRFATMTWDDSPDDAAPAGLDPTGPAFTRPALARLVAASRQQMKPWLLRQDRLAGVGNIYASEILHRARISPFRKAGSLRAEEIARLHAAVRRTLNLAIKWNGTTFSDFQDVRGVTGGFLRFLQVYDREGRPCRRCGAAVRRVVQQQRSTYYCPRCVAKRGR